MTRGTLAADRCRGADRIREGVMGRRLRQPNQSLAALIAEAGFSKKGLAARVVRAGESRGIRDLRFNHSSVERWLRGEQPRPPTPSLLAEVFSARLARPVTVADLGMSPHDRVSDEAALRMPLTTAEAARVVHGLAGGDLEQRRALISSGFDAAAYSSAALRWLLSPRAVVSGSDGSRRIGAGDVRAIREAIQAFRMLDNRLGGGRIRPTVVSYLHVDIAPLLREARCTDSVRRQLFSAAAELSQLCGWQAHDLEMQGLAQRYLVQALSMARFAQDDGLGGEILAAMSQQAVYVAQPDQAVDMAHAAHAAARRAGWVYCRPRRWSWRRMVTHCDGMWAHARVRCGARRRCLSKRRARMCRRGWGISMRRISRRRLATVSVCWGKVAWREVRASVAGHEP